MSSLAFLTEDERSRLLERAEHRTYAPGEVLVNEGDDPRVILFVRTGRISIEREHLGGRVPIDEAGPGEVLGEMSFVARMPTTATLVASEPTDVDAIDAVELEALLDGDPQLASHFYRSLARTLAVRLRQSADARLAITYSWG